MTTTLAPARTADTRTVRRVTAAVALSVGALSIAALRFVMPYQTNDDVPAQIAKVAADPGAQRLMIWLGFLGVLATVPAALAAGRLAMRRAPVLATLGSGLTVLAFIGLAFGAGDPTLLAVATTSGDPVVMENLLAQGVPTAGIILYVVGHIAGMVLLGIALIRSRAVPAWAGWLLLVSQPLHFVFAVVVPSRIGDTLAWGAAAVALTCCAVQVLRTPDDEWDLAPVR